MKTKYFVYYSIPVLIIGLLMFNIPQSLAAKSQLHKTLNGVDIYLGVLPAEIVRGHPKKHPESRMHGGVPAGTLYHVILALFDAKTGDRIQDAKISAKVVGTAAVEITKPLDPMSIAGARSYGNYFKMLGQIPQHLIVLEITRPGMKGTIRTTFEWARP
ncbi:MAG: hypothetical protein ACC635_04495 [Acidiferrobacterales bacterium]